MASPIPTEELLDLRFLPAWVNEPVHAGDYADFQGEDFPYDDGKGRQGPRRRDRDRPRDRNRESRGPKSREDRPRRPRQNRPGAPRGMEKQRGRHHTPSSPPPRPLNVTVRFLPHLPALDSVIAQIKSGAFAYSVFALARLFLEKPERYDVQLTSPEDRPLFQLGENGPVAAERSLLEEGAFVSLLNDFYTVEVTQNEPLKGNFTNVARCRLSRTLLGPTNHHNYQPQLRTLYETRFRRRMSFFEYQNQIEIVSDPVVVEEWKEQARNVTTYTSKSGDPPLVFNNLAEVERDFRKNYLPNLLRSAHEIGIGGVLSRRLTDRALGRAIEEAWAKEIRSPSKMMQELTTKLRQGSLNIFRHRRGMLFVSPIRARAFSHESASVSASINAILEKVTGTPGINRKQLAEQLAPAGNDPVELERAKLSLAADLHWLVSEGYVIEFNDNSLDLPRTRQPASAVEETAKGADELMPAEVTSETQPAESQEVETQPNEEGKTDIGNETAEVLATSEAAPEAIKAGIVSLPAE